MRRRRSQSDAGEGSLGVLPVDAQDREAVGLHLDIAAGDLAEAEAGVDRREGDRDLLLAVIDAQALERPAGDRDIAVGVIRSALMTLRSRSSLVRS